MAFDYSKLRGKIVEVYKTQERFADAMGISSQSLSNKLNNKVDWRRDEIKKACTLLGIALDNLSEYFFATKIKIS